jgi:hypothetical protein
MKKTTLFLVAFALLALIFGVSNVANATAPSATGCQNGYLFNPFTGAPCSEPNLPPGCLPGYTFSYLSGVRCASYPLPVTTPVPAPVSSIVIDGVSGPQTLDVNQKGTWTVTAYDKNGDDLSYEVVWSDEEVRAFDGYSGISASAWKQSATFTHSYSETRTYKPTFIVRNESGQTAQASLSVKVGTTPSSSLTVLSPNGGEIWKKGTMQTIKWQNEVNASCAVGIPCVVPVKYYDIWVSPSFCNGKVYPNCMLTPYTVAQHVSGSSYNWSVGSYIDIEGSGETIVPDGAYAIQVCEVGGNVGNCDSTDSYFKITSGAIEPSVKVMSPNGGETWAKGTTQMIVWRDSVPFEIPPCAPFSDCSNGPHTYTYDITLQPVGGNCDQDTCVVSATPYTIATHVSGTYGETGLYYKWYISPNLEKVSGPYKVQVCRSGTSTCDSSDGYFKITSGSTATNNPPEITYSSHRTYDNSVALAETETFSWKAEDENKDNLSWGVNWGDGMGTNGVCPTNSIYTTDYSKSWSYSASHAWMNPGTYKVTVSVNDCRGGTDSQTIYVTVGGGEALACRVDEIYSVQVPGYVYSNLYMRVSDMLSSDDASGDIAITGADSWNNLTFKVVSTYASDFTKNGALLQANQTLNDTAVSYIMHRKYNIKPVSIGEKKIDCSPMPSIAVPATTGSVYGAESFTFTEKLELGSKGTEVQELQRYLSKRGYYYGNIDGEFGLKTKLALVSFQITNGLNADGVVGAAVRNILNKY